MTTDALPSAGRVQFTYLLLTLLSTLAASFIWGINTLFLLDAGLSNTAAFAANAFFAVGQLVFEVPTGVVADVWGRRVSFLLGCATLLVSTLLYLYMWDVQAGMWGWAIASILLGLGFTFFSGAVEAWLVDALDATGFTGRLESVFGRAQAVSRGGDPDRIGGRGLHRPGDQPRCALHPAGGGPRHHLRGGVLPDAGRGIHPAARREGFKRGASRGQGVGRQWAAQPACSLADAHLTVHRWGRLLCLLCLPALSARVVRRRGRLRDRRARRCHIRRPPRSSVVSPRLGYAGCLAGAAPG